MILLQIAFALDACGGLAGIVVPSTVSTASKKPVNWPARSLIRNLTEAARCPRSIRKLRAACLSMRRQVRGEACQVDAAGAVLDDDQGVDASQQHGVHVDELDAEDAAGLGGQELLPGQAWSEGSMTGLSMGVVITLASAGK
jgi:hypothetical protein